MYWGRPTWKDSHFYESLGKANAQIYYLLRWVHTGSSPVKTRKSTCFRVTHKIFQKHMLRTTFRLLRICTPVNAAAGLSFEELTAPVWEESQTWSKYEQFSAENQLMREVEEWLPAAILARSTLSTAEKLLIGHHRHCQEHRNRAGHFPEQHMDACIFVSC